MIRPAAPIGPDPAPAALRRAVARRLTETHRVLADASLLAFADASAGDARHRRSAALKVGFVLTTLPDEAQLAQACERAGGSAWFRRQSGEGRLVVACRIDGLEVEVDYVDRAALDRAVDASAHDRAGDAALPTLGDAILKAEPLAGHAELARLKARLTRLPPQLACALVKRFMATPTPWRAIAQLGQRYEVRRCRELQVDACYRLCAVGAALNQRYFTRFQVRRTNGSAPQFENAPPGLAEKIARLMEAPPRFAFAQLFALEGEVLDQVARNMPQVSLAMAQAQRAAYVPG
jgi:hypothetical protein